MANPSSKISRVWVDVLTPFTPSFQVDTEHWINHIKTLSIKGITHFVLFGKAGEGECLSTLEKMRALKALTEHKAISNLVLGIQASSPVEIASLIRNAIQLGVHQFLITPPAFTDQISREGLVAHFRYITQLVGQDNWSFFLHIWGSPGPLQIADASILDLHAACKKHIVGLVDEGTSLARTNDYLKSFAGALPVVPTFEPNALYLKPSPLISAVANLAPNLVSGLLDEPLPPPAEKEVAGLKVRDPHERFHELQALLNNHPRLPTLKHLMGRFTHDNHWKTLHPPQYPLSEPSQVELDKSFKQFHIQPNE